MPSSRKRYRSKSRSRAQPQTRSMSPAERRMSALSGQLTRECIKQVRYGAHTLPRARSPKEAAAKAKITKAKIEECRAAGRVRSARRRMLVHNDPTGQNALIESQLIAQYDALPEVTIVEAIANNQLSADFIQHLGMDVVAPTVVMENVIPPNL